MIKIRNLILVFILINKIRNLILVFIFINLLCYSQDNKFLPSINNGIDNYKCSVVYQKNSSRNNEVFEYINNYLQFSLWWLIK